MANAQYYRSSSDILVLGRPIWVIARLKIKLEHARMAIHARSQVCFVAF
jgi:hypothetical protein